MISSGHASAIEGLPGRRNDTRNALVKWATMGALSGKIAVVAGATRGAGRGIACGLGEAGATVYCTGRSVRGYVATPGRPETIEETAEMVTAAGGKGIPAQVDHTDEGQVQLLFEQVQREQERLDIL